MKFFSKNCKTEFLPRYQGSEKMPPPIIWQKIKIILEGRLIAQMKHFDSLITPQKTSALCKVPFLKKSRETFKKLHFCKNCIFLRFLLIFFIVMAMVTPTTFVERFSVSCMRDFLLSFF